MIMEMNISVLKVLNIIDKNKSERGASPAPFIPSFGFLFDDTH